MSTYINFIFQVLIPNLSLFFDLRSIFLKLNTILNTIFISIIQLIEFPVRNHCGSKINLLPYSFVLPFGSKPCWFKPLLFVKSKWACPKSGSGVEWDLCSAADKASSTSASEAVINYGKKIRQIDEFSIQNFTINLEGQHFFLKVATPTTVFFFSIRFTILLSSLHFHNFFDPELFILKISTYFR